MYEKTTSPVEAHQPASAIDPSLFEQGAAYARRLLGAAIAAPVVGFEPDGVSQRELERGAAYFRKLLGKTALPGDEDLLQTDVSPA